MKYTCKSDGDYGDSILSIKADESSKKIRTGPKASSVVLNYHPWVAKGPEYIKMSRTDKADILWSKITESNEIGEVVDIKEGFFIDSATAFDEWGDEIECRKKAIHSQGNVGKATWEDLGGHKYTGIFKGGADTGFARLSTVIPVNTDI